MSDPFPNAADKLELPLSLEDFTRRLEVFESHRYGIKLFD